jgi:predicted Zn-dependent protease
MASNGSGGGVNVRWAPLLLGLLAILFMVFTGWQTGPFGRHQVVALSPQQEAQLGAQAFQQILNDPKSDVVERGPALDAVKRIGVRLARASEQKDVLEKLGLPLQHFDWEFRLLRSPQVNAFCLPGGKVVVYTGILPVCQTEAGLATVMGHEIGHALAHHGAERMAQQKIVAVGSAAIAGALDTDDPRKRAQVLALLGTGSQVGILLPFSRSHESEADHIGLLLMAAAGYDPDEAVEFWGRMEKQGGSKTPEFLSTHPSHGHRIQDLRGWLPEAMPLYEASSKADGNAPLPRP